MKALKWINTAALAATVAVNALANLLPLGGNTTGQVLEAYPSLFTPAPVTFAVWGLIYLLLAVFVVYQWGVFDDGRYSTKVREDIGPWFAISCALNIAWVFLWHNRQIGLSAIVIALLLLSIIMIRRKLTGADGNFLTRMAAASGFSVYFGWIIAATVANVCVFAAKTGRIGTGFPAELWTSTVMLIGAAAAAGVVLLGKDRIAGATLMWAYAGILIRHLSKTYYGGAHPIVIAAGILCELVILAAILMPMIRKIIRKRKFAPVH